MSEQIETRPETSHRDAKQVFHGLHLAKIVLTGPTSEKHTQHHGISLCGAPATYLPGDALGVHPSNDTALVDRVIAAIHASGDERVTSPRGEVSLREAITHCYALAAPSRRLLELMAQRGATDLAPLLEAANTHQFKAFVSGPEAHDILDVLESHPDVAITPGEFVATLRSLLPRLYSIASSLKVHPDEVHVIVVSVRYTLRGRERLGVCSTWLNDRWPQETVAEMYLQNQQKHFAMPVDPATPLIMIGPGTGIAPFRAFIEERRVTGATGGNWLFFGEQRQASDFFYEAEFSSYVRDGSLRLDTAFSRDQAQKVYVQHRMREQARDIYTWLEDGAEFFVCGDKERMAADVDLELHRIVETIGGKTPDQAKEYVEGLRKTKRYKRDVY
ncbi:MAG: sulfite reductase subunit alpha [Acidobacteriota bacterium]